LTEEERDNYFYWVGLRNSFYFSEDSNQLEKLVKYFTPEEEDYYSNLFSFSVPFIICAAVVIVLFLFYLVKRFLLKGCKGPKIYTKSYDHVTYFFLITGFAVGFISLCVTIHNARKSNSNISKMMDFTQDQKELLRKVLDETLMNQQVLAGIFKNDKKVNTTIYGLNLIESDTNVLEQKLQSFYDDLYAIQKHKFRFQVSALILFLLISLIGVAGYWVRREYIPWIASVLLILLSAPVFIMAGLETTYTFLSIDFCSSVGNSVISGIIPSENRGLGMYLSCPSKQTMRTISTAIYQFIVNFDDLYNQTDYLINGSALMKDKYALGLDKRNNSHFKRLYDSISKDYYIDNEDETKAEYTKSKETVLLNLSSFAIFNYVLAGLLSMTSCMTAKNSINFIEEQYCFKNHAYMFRNVVFDVLSAVGFIIMAVGLNKLIITMRSHLSRALRGKKEFNTDIIDDDDD
jgi:flagellar biogenesis protein FliO